MTQTILDASYLPSVSLPLFSNCICSTYFLFPFLCSQYHHCVSISLSPFQFMVSLKTRTYAAIPCNNIAWLSPLLCWLYKLPSPVFLISLSTFSTIKLFSTPVFHSSGLRGTHYYRCVSCLCCTSLYRIDISLVTSDPGDVLGDVLALFA